MKNSITNYKDAVAFIGSLSNISQLNRKSPKAAQKRLKMIKDFLAFLGNPQKKLKIIHITGTSGKGSVATMLHSIFFSAGKKIGCYTSPHTTTFCERIKAGDKFISEKELAELVDFLKNKMDEFVRPTSYKLQATSSLNFLEFSFCLAVCYFARKKCEYAIIEAGCGGRRDATNAIGNPVYSIITNVGRDHTKLLGNSLGKIAYEKAGIIKKSAPLLTGEKRENLLKIFQRECKALNTRYLILGTKDIKNIKTDLNCTKFEYRGEQYKLFLLGEHQARNAALAIECAEDLGISRPAIKRGLAKTFYPARLEAVSKNPLIIIDGAHNADKIKATIKFLQATSYPPLEPPGNHSDLWHQKTRRAGKLQAKYLIIGMAKSKKIKKEIKELFDFFDKVYITRFSNPFRKAMSWNDWQKIAKSKKDLYYYHYPMDALLAALTKLRKNDLLVITGSICLAGELRKHWYPEEKIIKFRNSTKC